ncbi:hypothetical protein FISHEDRAFT_32601 [Fistulina hepatica ATCC 64428]|uniref:Uncharacterized protein n=1 Tax=Fistulina hepatica ATCC 64428 TaxID=1128425 RepID=A0A0D7AQ02_9AGAR|nr:hypothetical protein FISHEDRAFT_32601 [Fistulina hepatica ATCC 64428]
MWDMTPPHWDSSSPLKIFGHPIPMIYWPDVYRYWKGPQWQGFKSSHTKIKYLVARWRCSGFYEEFSKDMSATDIYNILLQQRKEENQRKAQQIRDRYGEQFGQVFCYRSRNTVRVMADPTKIVDKYNSLSPSEKLAL